MKFDKVILIGAGGIGSIVLEPLVRLLMYHENGTLNVHVYDGDTYEKKNQSRQLFPPEFVGKNKAVAQAERLAPFAPNVMAHAEYLNQDRLSDAILLSGCEMPLVITAVDREMSRHVVIKALDDLSNDMNYACILPGNGYESANCFTYWCQDGAIAPVHPFNFCSEWAAPTDTIPGACGDQAVDSPQLIAANMKAASFVLDSVTALLDDRMPSRLFGVRCHSIYTQELYECLP